MCIIQFSSVQSLNRVWLFATPCIAARQASLSITNSRSLLKLMPIESVMSCSHLILSRPLLLLPPTTPIIRVFSNESTLLMSWPTFWSFSFSISPSHEHWGLISFRMDWLDLLAVQGTLESLLQHHSSKASIFPRSAFFTVQLLHPYMTTGKTVAFIKASRFPLCRRGDQVEVVAWLTCVMNWRDLCLVIQSCLTLSDPMNCSPQGSSGPWDFSGKNTRVDCHFLLQGIFLTQGSNQSLLHWQVNSLPLSHLGSLLLDLREIWWKLCSVLYSLCFPVISLLELNTTRNWHYFWDHLGIKEWIVGSDYTSF